MGFKSKNFPLEMLHVPPCCYSPQRTIRICSTFSRGLIKISMNNMQISTRNSSICTRCLWSSLCSLLCITFCMLYSAVDMVKLRTRMHKLNNTISGCYQFYQFVYNFFLKFDFFVIND